MTEVSNWKILLMILSVCVGANKSIDRDKQRRCPVLFRAWLTVGQSLFRGVIGTLLPDRSAYNLNSCYSGISMFEVRPHTLSGSILETQFNPGSITEVQSCLSTPMSDTLLHFTSPRVMCLELRLESFLTDNGYFNYIYDLFTSALLDTVDP